jgi:thiol-disulfide isomerase/thioredoxin
MWMLVVALLVATGCSDHPRKVADTSSEEVGVLVVPEAQRQPAPDLSGTTLTGASMDLSHHTTHGTVTLVNVWASWCEPCRREMPMLARAATGRRSTLRVVGIDERDKTSSARAFTASLSSTYPSFVDTDSRLLAKLPLLPHNAIPSSLFIDRHGRVAARVIGPITSHGLSSVLSQLGKTS